MPSSESFHPWSIEPQTVEDLITGLTFEFRFGADGVPVLRVSGDAIPGHREIRFPESTRVVGRPRDPFPEASHVN